MSGLRKNRHSDRRERLNRAFLFVCFFIFITRQVEAASIKLSFAAMLDFRLISTDESATWLSRGFGKARYGGDNEDRSTLARLSQSSVLVSASFADQLSGRIQLNVDAEPEREWKRNRVDVIEAFLAYRSVISPHFRFRARGGIFFPPVSLENRDLAWSPVYTITASAANSWIGEEVRVTGVESGFVFEKASNQLTLSGALFFKNDPTASLLAWRGWTFSDRQSGLTDELPLAPIQAISPGGLFPRQPPFVEPFREVDDRISYYATVSWMNRYFEFNALHYDNRGKQTVFDDVQYAWDTRFGNVGVVVPFLSNFQLISQFLTGNSRMGFDDMVNIDFRTGYILLTFAPAPHRLTVRYDGFRVNDRDLNKLIDNNNENGHAWTFAYLLTIRDRHRIAFEVLRIHSGRSSRLDLGLNPHSVELQFQSSLRLKF